MTISNEQNYLYEICLAVTSGLDNLEYRYFENMCLLLVILANRCTQTILPLSKL